MGSFKGRVALLSAGPDKFVECASRLFMNEGACVIVQGKNGQTIGNETVEADSTLDAGTVCAEISSHGLKIDTLIVCALWQTTLTYEIVAAEIHKTVAYLKTTKDVLGEYPKYVVIVTPQKEDNLASAGSASIKTLTGYLTRHLLEQDVRINLCRYAPSEMGMRRTAEAVFMICSGLLDDLRGQQLTISGD